MGTRLCLAGMLAAALMAPAAAQANGSLLTPVDVPVTDLADGTGATGLSAASGHVVFSRLVPSDGRYELVAWTASTGLRVLPVGQRSVPFDADVGPGADGDVVVSFSRCSTDGTPAYVLPVVDFTKARGCRLEILNLDRAGAQPRSLRLAHSAGLSLTTPSVRRGSVAAVASPARGSTNARVLYWRTTKTKPLRLHGGTAPKCPFTSCQTAPRSGVDALDLGPKSVAFVWRLTESDLGTDPGQELRTSPLGPGAGEQLPTAQGYLSGACGFRQPLSPTADADGGVSFLLAQSPCEELQTTLAVKRGASKRMLGARPAGVLAYGAAYDGGRVYWLRGAAPASTEASPRVPCASEAAGCRLVSSSVSALPLRPATAH